MKQLLKAYVLVIVALLVGASLQAQTAVTQTTLSGAVTSNSSNRFTLASTTNVVAGTVLFLDQEEAVVESLVGGGAVQVQRGAQGTRASSHISGTGVLIGPPQAYGTTNPQGTCTPGQGRFQYTLFINVTNATLWNCGINGVPGAGFQNRTAFPNSTPAVASVAGLITPTGPLFHITGALAITGFNIPVGFNPKAGGEFCVVPDGAYTVTTANNIAHASTAIVGVTQCFTYDPNASKPFSPSY